MEEPMIDRSQADIMKKWKESGPPLVSIAMITYNHEEFLEQALEGCLLQETDFPFEIVFHDDASTDKSPDILQRYMEKYPKIIRGIFQKENQYSQDEDILTILFKELDAPYIAILESDDYWIDPQKLQIQIERMQENPQCHLSFHPAELRIGHNASGDVISKHAEHEKIFSVPEVIKGGGYFCPTASLVIRREVLSILDDSKILEHSPVGDFFLQVCASLNGGALYIDRVMAVYRQGIEGSWSASVVQMNNRIELYRKLREWIEKLDLYLNREYHDEFLYRKSIEDYRMAGFYLQNGRLKEYQEHMQISHDTFPLKSISYNVEYCLRSFPRIVKAMKSVKKYLLKWVS